MDFNNLNLSELEKAPFEVRHCQTIGELRKIREESKVHPQFCFDEIRRDGKTVVCKGIPSLNEGEFYNLTSWNSLHIIRALGESSFEISEEYGATELITSKKYLLIETCY